jgi:hypothetical protein
MNATVQVQEDFKLVKLGLAQGPCFFTLEEEIHWDGLK